MNLRDISRDLPNLDVIIMYGHTEKDIAMELVEHGLLPADAVPDEGPDPGQTLYWNRVQRN